jgi:hypothetical protein
VPARKSPAGEESLESRFSAKHIAQEGVKLVKDLVRLVPFHGSREQGLGIDRGNPQAADIEQGAEMWAQVRTGCLI